MELFLAAGVLGSGSDPEKALDELYDVHGGNAVVMIDDRKRLFVINPEAAQLLLAVPIN